MLISLVQLLRLIVERQDSHSDRIREIEANMALTVTENDSLKAQIQALLDTMAKDDSAEEVDEPDLLPTES
jgi:hypothetical protein